MSSLNIKFLSWRSNFRENLFKLFLPGIYFRNFLKVGSWIYLLNQKPCKKTSYEFFDKLSTLSLQNKCTNYNHLNNIIFRIINLPSPVFVYLTGAYFSQLFKFLQNDRLQIWQHFCNNELFFWFREYGFVSCKLFLADKFQKQSEIKWSDFMI